MKMSRMMMSLLLCATFCVSMQTIPVSAEEIELVGTDDGEHIFAVIAEAFNQNNPETRITLPDDIGSSGAIKAVGRDQAVLGRVARTIKEAEEPYGLSHVPFATTPVVFYVNKSANIQQLTELQVLDIYSGKITNWSEIGGADVKIRVVNHEEGDSNLEVLEESFPGFEDITVTSKSKTTYEDDEAIELAEKTDGVIAYGNYADAREADVIVLSIAGRHPSAADYPYATTLGFVFKEKHLQGGVEQFIKFATSGAVHDAIREAGGIPLE